MFKRAFTMAEVLITLGIIGIVAAITIPTLVQRHKSKVIISQLKKSYSELQYVSDCIFNDYGENFFNIVKANDNQGVKNIIMKYYPGSVDCPDGKCYTSKGISYITYTGTSMLAQGSNSNYYFGLAQFLTKDGRLVSVGGANDNGRMISVDVNGPFKKPNAWGRDTFTFRITENKVSPCGGNTSCSNVYNYNCRRSDTGNYSGIGCTYYALYKSDFLDKKYYYDNYILGEL